MLTGRIREDAGVALVVALLVTLIAFVLATAVLADAFQTVAGTLRAQQRVGAIDVAEAGINWFLHDIEGAGHGPNYLTGTPPPVGASPPPPASPWHGSGSGPFTITPQAMQGGTFSLAVRYKTTAGADLNLATVNPFPKTFAAEVTSVGVAGGSTRTLRATLVMQPNYGSIGGAFSGMFICELGNRFTVTGSDVDLYLIGDTSSPSSCGNDLVVNSGQFSVSGSVWVLNGAANLTAKTFIGGDLWAKTTAQVGAGSGGATAGAGDCSPSATLAKVIVCGDVTAGTTPIVSKTQGAVLGSISTCVSPCLPPDIQFPVIKSGSTMFSSQNWDPQSALPSAGTDGVTTMPSVATYYTLPCSSSPVELPLKILLMADTALLSDCGFSISGNFEVSSATTGRYTLYLVTYYVLPASCAKYVNTEFKNNVDATGVDLFIYNPCELTFRNQVNMAGQLVGRQLRAQGQTTIAYASTVVKKAALASISSFRADLTELYEVG